MAVRKIDWDGDITFGQYKGQVLRERFAQDPSYFRWFFQKDPQNTARFTTGALAAMAALDWKHYACFSCGAGAILPRVCSVICSGFCQYVSANVFDDDITNVLLQLREIYDDSFAAPLGNWFDTKEGAIVLGVGTVDLASDNHVDVNTTVDAITMRRIINKVIDDNKKTTEWQSQIEIRQTMKSEYYETHGIAYGDW